MLFSFFHIDIHVIRRLLMSFFLIA